MTVIERADTRVAPVRAAPLRELPPQDERPRDGEEQSIARVVTSLVAMFPTVPESHVRDCVNDVRARFATAPIRTYLPILVARQARAALITYLSSVEGAPVG